MDILFLLKSEQESLVAAAADFYSTINDDCAKRQATFENLSSKVAHFLALDAEFLYPEVGDLFTQASKAIKYGLEQHSKINKRLVEISRLLSSDDKSAQEEIKANVTALVGEIRQHVDYQQESLIPHMREVIPTQDREDLAEVFIDVKEELLKRLSTNVSHAK